MACGSCGGGKAGSKMEYVYIAKDGTQKTYSSETEARMAVTRKGGRYRARQKAS